MFAFGFIYLYVRQKLFDASILGVRMWNGITLSEVTFTEFRTASERTAIKEYWEWSNGTRNRCSMYHQHVAIRPVSEMRRARRRRNTNISDYLRSHRSMEFGNAEINILPRVVHTHT